MIKLIEELYGIDTNRFNRDQPIVGDIIHPLDERPGFDKDTGFTGNRSGLHDGPIFNRIPTADPSTFLNSPLATATQKQFYNRVYAKQDTIIALAPAAGKTSPLLNAWFDLTIKAIKDRVPYNSPEFPRILYIAKTKQLATEARAQNFIGDKETGLFNLISKMSYYFPKINIEYLDAHGHARDPDKFEHISLTNKNIQEIYETINDMVGFLTGGININNVKSKEYIIKPIIVSTPIDGGSSSILNLVKQYKNYFSIIAIDEFQEYLPRPSSNPQVTAFPTDLEENFKLMTQLIKTAPSQCGVHIMTGTVNKNTIKEFKNALNTIYNKNFEILNYHDTKRHTEPGVKNIEYTANRSEVKVIPYEKMQTNQDLQKLIIQIVKSKQTNTLIIIFSTKRAAQKGIFRLLEDVMSKLPVRFQHITGTITTDDYSSIKNDPDFNVRISDPRSANISLSGKKIEAGVSLNDLKNTYAGNYIDPEFNKNLHPPGQKTVEVSDIEYLKYFNVDQAEERSLEQKHDITFEGNLLYQGVLRGIGVMIGNMPDRMKLTIQKLFREGKIYVILATNSLGIGANVLARTIYIPDLEKFEGGGMAPLDTSSLIQLVNRAGRTPSKIPFATIYCSLKDYKRVNDVFNQDPATATEELSFEEIKKQINNNDRYLHFLWSKIIGY